MNGSLYNNTPNYFGATITPQLQPSGMIYQVQNTMEVNNVPASAGITAILCQNESLLYLKTVQNGVPTFLAYKLSPYTESPKMAARENDIEVRLAALEKQFSTLLIALGGKRNDEPIQQSTTVSNATSTVDWG